MNWSAGTPRPRSWKDTKLTTYLSRGLGSGSPNGAIHSGLSGSVIGRRRLSSMSDYNTSTDMSDGSQGSAEKPPQRARLPLSANGRGIFPQPIHSRLRNRAPSPLRSRGSKAGPPRVSTAVPGQQSQGQLWASPYMVEARASDRSGCPKSCLRPAESSLNGIPP